MQNYMLPSYNVASVSIPDPVESYAKVLNLQGIQSQNALHQMQLQAAQQSNDQQNALNAAWKLPGAFGPDGSANMPAIANSLAVAGHGSIIPAQMKAIQEIDKQRAETDKTFGEAVKTRTEQHRAELDKVTNPMGYMDWVNTGFNDPILSRYFASIGVTREKGLFDANNSIQTLGLDGAIQRSALGMSKWLEANKPTNHVVDQYGQKSLVSVPGLGGSPTTLSTYADVPLPQGVQQQKIDVANAGAAKFGQPVAAVDTVTGKGKFIGVNGKGDVVDVPGAMPPALITSLAPKEIQRREAEYPQMVSAKDTAIASLDKVTTVATQLLNHPGLSSMTGFWLGRSPIGLTPDATAALAKYKQLVGNLFIESIAQMKAASPNGSTGIGPATEPEGQRLIQAQAALDRAQSTDAVKKALREFISGTPAAKSRINNLFNQTYEYRDNLPNGTPGARASEPSTKTAPAKGWGKAVAE